nr:AT-hook motif nuclear-localized protein 1-like [Tanacetum cinerariifolium]
MESRESVLPPVETRAPEVPPSNYQLALKTESPAQSGNPSQMRSQVTGPLGFSPVSGGSGIPSSLEKKKRGRPRKYGPDGVATASGRTLSPMPLASATSPTSGGGYSDIKFGEATGSGSEFQKEKKRRRRKSSEILNLSLGDQITSGGSFTPHMVTVNPGEDVTSKIISFSKYGPRAICVLSALGIISHVTLRQASSSGGTGRFEILSLSGSFTPGESGGVTSREGGMSIALSSPDGRVVGGLLGGILTAAGPVQVVVASFLPEAGNPMGPKPRRQNNDMQLLTTTEDPTIPRTRKEEQQNFNEQSQESTPTENTSSAPPPAPPQNYQHENHAAMSTMHDWRRTTTDMNVSLRED